jgi:hypothetical protein
MKSQSLGTIRVFKTKNFRVEVTAETEFDVDLSWDDTGEVARELDRGGLVVFCVRAACYGPGGEELAVDYLGQCIYKDFDSFMDHRECGKQNLEYEARGDARRCGSYFADMVSNVCVEGRKAFVEARAKSQRIRMRDVKVTKA